ncbi:MAG TPA: TonB-dependent receptor, partial [Chitinophagaceae bacterium]|nr:TonB-dependent receptor [Chitinophagaceae bacterium]
MNAIIKHGKLNLLQERQTIFILFSLTIIFFAAISTPAFSQEIKGKVTDLETGESLIDATVTLKNTSKTYTSITGLDGSYIFKNIEAGTYIEVIQYVGYDEKHVKIEAKKGIIIRNNILLKPHTDELNAVIVNASINKESDLSARKTERVASNLLNIISAKAIENSPDITVGNVLQRATGVSVQKNSSGDGEKAIIRGMA